MRGAARLLALQAVLGTACARELVVGDDSRDAGAPVVTTLTQGLVAYWSLDDGPGRARALDRSGNANDAIPESVSASDWVVGRLGGALLFGQAGWLKSAVTPSLNTIKNGLTIATWIQRTTDQLGYRVILQRQVGATNFEHYAFGLVDGRPTLSGRTIGSSELSTPVPLGRWVHVAATYDGRTRRLYVDGEEAGSGNRTAEIPTDTTPLTIGGALNGADPEAAGEKLQGMIDDLAVYSRALPAAEIRALASGQSPR